MEPDSIAQPGIGPTTAVPGSGYSGKSFDTANPKYLVSNHSYPSDLMGNLTEYGNNYVIFYINVNDAAKMLENSSSVSAQTVNIDASERDKSVLSSQSISGAAAATGAAAAALGPGALAGVVAGASKGGTSGVMGGIKGALAGAFTAGGALAGIAVGATAVLAIEQGSKFQRSQKRLKTAIALNVPNQLSIRYRSNYGDEETSTFQIGVEAFNALSRAKDTKGSSLIPGSTASAIAAATALKAAGAGGAAALSSITGLAPNPMKEQIFKGVDFRSFTMDYMFAPRNEAEAQNVLGIIKAFKYHMLPEYKKGSNFLFLYPSEFDIVYFNGGKENLNVHRHTSCVLTEINVNYTPQGMFNTFRNGMPTQISINMTFNELAIVTKESVERGM